jgi:hypothetical protein
MRATTLSTAYWSGEPSRSGGRKSSSNPMGKHLSAFELELVMQACQPLAPKDRAGFLKL